MLASAQFFQEIDFSHFCLEGDSFWLLREDGLSLYGRGEEDEKVFALMGGMFQAARSLFEKEKLDILEWRGEVSLVLLAEVKRGERREIAILKTTEKELSGKKRYYFKKLLYQYSLFLPMAPVKEERKGEERPLFENLQDSEIDTLFSGVGE